MIINKEQFKKIISWNIKCIFMIVIKHLKINQILGIK